VADEHRKKPRLIDLPVCVMTDAVLFPRTLLPVRLEAPARNRLIQKTPPEKQMVVVALLQPDGEGFGQVLPAVYRTAGLGIITDCHVEDEGSCQILIKGRRRCEIMDLLQQRSTEIARVRLLPETRLPVPGERRLSADIIGYFLEVVEPVFPPGSGAGLLRSLDFATLVNSICSCLNISVHAKQELLEANNLKERSARLLALLKLQKQQKRFVSDFTHLKPADPTLN
jgi:ATP-dependent Lon protease